MKLLNWIIALPFLILAVLFVVSNRQDVDVNIWPLPFEITLPLSGLGAGLFVVGFLIGGTVAWLGAGRTRARVRELDRKLRLQSKQLAELEQSRKKVEKQLDETVESNLAIESKAS